MSLKVADAHLVTVSKDTVASVVHTDATLKVADAAAITVSKSNATPEVIHTDATLKVADAHLITVNKDSQPPSVIRTDATLKVADVRLLTVARERAFYVEVETSISGTVCSTNANIKSTVIAISLPEGDTVGKAEADANGNYTIDTSPYEGFVAVVRVQDYGERFQTSKIYAEGETVHPEPPNGNIFECTTAGQAGTVEPDWQPDVTVTGNAIFKTVPLYQPTAAGYVQTVLAT